jgi:hypothetical protein
MHHTHTDMPAPAGRWWLPRWARWYLTYRRTLNELRRCPAPFRNSKALAGEARTTADLIMDALG